MQSTFYKLVAAALVASALSFMAPRDPAGASDITGASAIKGRVDPPDGAVEALAMSTTDTVRSGISDGMFRLNVSHGTYKLVIIAREPYKTVIKDNVEVADGNTTDVGTIRLQE